MLQAAVKRVGMFKVSSYLAEAMITPSWSQTVSDKCKCAYKDGATENSSSRKEKKNSELGFLS